MSHTPGPWEVADTSIVTDDYCIAVIEDDGGYEVTGEQQIANAHLIAAAPDLLAVLQQIVASDEEANRELVRMGLPAASEDLTNIARAVIAKATTTATQERQ